MIIDAHVHALAPTVAGKGKSATRGQEEVVDQADLLVREMDTYGITMAVVQYGYGSNERIQSVVRKYPGRFVGFCGWDAGTSGKKAADTVQKWLKEPEFKGVGETRLDKFVVPEKVETLPEVMNEVRIVMDVVSQNKVPILFHTGFFSTRPGTATIPLIWKNPMLIDEIAVEYHNIPIIIGHCGGFYPPYDQNALMMAYNYENVYLETSRSRVDVVEKAVFEIGASRVLFGSDWVSDKPSPSGAKSERESHLYTRNLKVIEEARISDKDKEMILSTNIKLLLGLSV